MKPLTFAGVPGPAKHFNLAMASRRAALSANTSLIATFLVIIIIIIIIIIISIYYYLQLYGKDNVIYGFFGVISNKPQRTITTWTTVPHWQWRSSL